MKTQLPRWKLSDLLKSPKKDFQSLSQDMEHIVSQLEALRPHLNASVSPEHFKKAFHLYEDFSTAAGKLRAYASLWFAENTQNQKATAFEAQVRKQLTNFSNRLVFLDLWWQGLSKQKSANLLKVAGDIRYYLESLLQVKPYTLKETEEQIITIKNSTGREALETLYGMFTNNFTFHLTIKKRRRVLTREELSAYIRSPSSHLRKAAYQELFRVYGNQKNVIGEMYKTLVSDWKNEGLTLRRYRSPLAVRNVANDIPDEAVETLLATCRKNASLFQQYFYLKARLLGLKSLNRYDLYAPVTASKVTYSFDKARSIVFESYKQFSPTLAEMAERVWREHHLDAQIRPGKIGGAFCYSVHPKKTPYVLLNYTGQARDISTLAHELGHAVHSMLAERHSILTFHVCLPLAETASVFGEQLLSETLLSRKLRKRERQSLLVTQLDDLYATILRQAFFVEFEKTAHQSIEKGATVDDLGRSYQQLLLKQFGRAIAVPPEFQWEWLAIPHIFVSPFYCYAYSFGNLLVLALYQQYKKEGAAFVPKYLSLLGAGGSSSPESVLCPLGVNIRSENFWQLGFDRIQELITALEQTL